MLGALRVVPGGFNSGTVLLTGVLSLCRILMAGILPFGAMFIELFFIFSVSPWPGFLWAKALLGRGLHRSTLLLPDGRRGWRVPPGHPLLCCFPLGWLWES